MSFNGWKPYVAIYLPQSPRNQGNKVPFGGINIVCVGDLFQLQPVMQQYIFMDLTSDYGPLATNLWKEHFTIFELTEIMWKKEDKKFAQLLNHLYIGEHTAADINLLKNMYNISRSIMSNVRCATFLPNLR